jgi:hypothetical protein
MHTSCRCLLPSRCAVTVWGTMRRGCLAGASRCQQGPTLLGRSRPQHTVDLSLDSCSRFPLLAAAPIRAVVALRGSCVAAWSRHHVALPPLLHVYAASSRAWVSAVFPPCGDTVLASMPPFFSPRTIAMPWTHCFFHPRAATVFQFTLSMNSSSSLPAD